MYGGRRRGGGGRKRQALCNDFEHQRHDIEDGEQPVAIKVAALDLAGTGFALGIDDYCAQLNDVQDGCREAHTRTRGGLVFDSPFGRHKLFLPLPCLGFDLLIVPSASRSPGKPMSTWARQSTVSRTGSPVILTLRNSTPAGRQKGGGKRGGQHHVE